jgi:hypothetical protein
MRKPPKGKKRARMALDLSDVCRRAIKLHAALADVTTSEVVESAVRTVYPSSVKAAESNGEAGGTPCRK